MTCISLGLQIMTSWQILFADVDNSLIAVITPMIILCYFELLQVFTFVESTSPLIKAMFQILNDIKSFIAILVFMMIAFANSFYILGKQ